MFVKRDFSAHYSARPNPKLLFHSLMKSFEKTDFLAAEAERPNAPFFVPICSSRNYSPWAVLSQIIF